MRLKTEGADPSDKLSRKYHIRQRKSLNPELLQNLKELNKLGLSVQSPLKNVRYAGHIKIPTVHNDYHTSKTNAGYSRNKLGGIYPK